MDDASEIMERRAEVLAFLKSRFPLYDRSNVFFRDIQYGLQLFLREKGIRTKYPRAEQIARQFVGVLEREGILVPIDRQSWALHYPEFRTPPAARAAAPAPPAAHLPAAKPAPEHHIA
jgi:hypothetical protein